MKRSSFDASRRLFLKQSTALSSIGIGAPLALNLAAMGSAAAQSTNDYKALVCIYMSGGNDAYNTVLPTDASSWSAYTAVRNQQPSSLALPIETLRTLNPAQSLNGRSLALHPQLKKLQSLFNDQRRLAIVSNVGPLIEPMSKADYTQAAKRLPVNLFSHNDQQCTWQALGPEGSTLGWGGRLADAVASDNGNSMFTAISSSGNAVWLSGKNVQQYQIQYGGVPSLGLATGADGVDQIYSSPEVAQAMLRIAGTARGGHKMEMDMARIAQRSATAHKALGNALPNPESLPYGPSANLFYTKPDGTKAVNPLAQQLQVVARLIGARQAWGMKRQIFYVSFGSFDTHDDQINKHADLMARLDHAMAYFDSVLSALGANDQVTTFTASDFGRTFTSNGDGTDHGWGGHHFVMGGGVKGGTVVGELPTYSLKNLRNNNFDNSPDQLNNGALLPRISVEQYGASLGRWFGGSSALATAFPNLSNFGGENLQLMR